MSPAVANKESEFKEKQCLDSEPESKTEINMFPENVPFFD